MFDTVGRKGGDNSMESLYNSFYDQREEDQPLTKDWVRQMLERQQAQGQEVEAAPTLAEMKPIDFSGAPAWWGKGEQSTPVGGTPAPADQQLPLAPATSPSKVINYIGNAGGRTGVTNAKALSNALRSAGGE